jgi:hypothetical protein
MELAMTSEQHLIDLERAGWEALSTGGETATMFYGQVLASRAVMLLPGGMLIDDRDQIIDSMRGRPWDEFQLCDERVHHLGERAAAVLYRAEAKRGDQEYTALCNSTYIFERGRWRLSVHQQTPA